MQTLSHLLELPRTAALAATLLAVSTVAAAGSAFAAQPVDRWERMLEVGREDDVVEQARRWLDKNADSELRPEVQRVLAEAEYQLLLSSPTIGAVVAWRDEFGESPRADDAFELLANLSLYAADDEGTEDAYRRIVDNYSGTAAATEAGSRAEETGFNEAASARSADAMGTYLGRYPDGPNAATAKRLWRSRVWDEAEAENTLATWLELRSRDPEHPRAHEAYMLEQALALAQLPPGASTNALLKLARRYESTPTGWETLRRALGASSFRISTADDAEILEGKLAEMSADQASVPGRELAAVSLDLVGPLPASAEITFSVEVQVDGRKWFDWNIKASEAVQGWGTALDEVSVREGPAVHWLTSAPPCALPKLTAGRVRVELRQERNLHEWILPVSVDQPCGGLLPLAVRYGADGVVEASSGRATLIAEPELQPLEVLAAGLPWSCSGALQVDAGGLWLSCSGWQVSVQETGLLFRPPPLGVASATGNPEHPALLGLEADPGQRWLALDVPTSWHFGGGPVCPLPAPALAALDAGDTSDAPVPAGDGVEPAGEAPTVDAEPAEGSDGAEPGEGSAPAVDAPSAPGWVRPGVETVADLEVDLDGDGLTDRLVVVASHDDHPAWVVLVLGSFPPDLSWTAPLTTEVPGEDTRVRRSGCGYEVLPTDG